MLLIKYLNDNNNILIDINSKIDFSSNLELKLYTKYYIQSRSSISTQIYIFLLVRISIVVKSLNTSFTSVKKK